MKKLIMLLLIGSTLLFSMAGCGNNNIAENTTMSSSSTTTPTLGNGTNNKPPDGLIGPVVLADMEKAKVIEIALNSPRASEWLKDRTDYRVGEVDWYAVSFEDGEASSWSVVNSESELPPPFLSQPVSYYPGITIAVGEGTIYQMQIAVDLKTQKVVMAEGPYPSLDSPNRFQHLTPPPSDTSSNTSQINREQAIENASKTLPASIVERADITAELHGWYWEVTFGDLNAKYEELTPWPIKPPPPFPGTTIPPDTSIYQSVVITIDALKGELNSAGAYHAPEPGPYINRERAIELAREMLFSIPEDAHWGISLPWFENAATEAYLRGDKWIVIFWNESSDDRHYSVTINAVTSENISSEGKYTPPSSVAPPMFP